MEPRKHFQLFENGEEKTIIADINKLLCQSFPKYLAYANSCKTPNN